MDVAYQKRKVFFFGSYIAIRAPPGKRKKQESGVKRRVNGENYVPAPYARPGGERCVIQGTRSYVLGKESLSVVRVPTEEDGGKRFERRKRFVGEKQKKREMKY